MRLLQKTNKISYLDKIYEVRYYKSKGKMGRIYYSVEINFGTPYNKAIIDGFSINKLINRLNYLIPISIDVRKVS